MIKSMYISRARVAVPKTIRAVLCCASSNSPHVRNSYAAALHSNTAQCLYGHIIHKTTELELFISPML